MKYIFGPVPSRRLGQSLGIDPIPLKTCNWNCVYCQLGRTRPLTNTRREYVPCQDILSEVQQVLADHQPGDIDWVTFVGSGEPTLHSGLGRLIRGVKELTDLPVALITNGALLDSPSLRAELTATDAVLPSLDAGNARLYRLINRPWPRLTFDRLVDGLASFRQEYRGKLWIEIMLLHDINDTEEALQELSTILMRIRPDQVHLLLPVRPPAESWVQPADEAGLVRAQSILSQVVDVARPEVVRTKMHTTDNLESALLGIITRHPMTDDELYVVLDRWSQEEIEQTLEKLHNLHVAKKVSRHGKLFWSAAGSYYAAEDSDSIEPRSKP